MRWPMKALSTVCATTVMVREIGTPLLLAIAKLRAKRASVAFSTMGPAIGRRSLALSHAYRPAGRASQTLMPQAPATAPVSSTGHHLSVKPETPSSTRVISGNSALKPANTVAKVGITKMLMTIIAITMAPITSVG